jgi:predicted HTH transcriptional regulator
MLSALDEGTETEKIMRTLRTGESKTIEFKQTFSVDVKTNKKEKYIEKMVLKTLVAFLNTEGGISLVGISDDKNIIGIQGEIQKYYKNDDKFLLHLKNLIKSSIGENFYPFVDYRFVDIESCKILLIECQPSDKPCYFESKDFYVRINPATDKLEGPKMVDYIQSHFKNK